MEKWTNTIKSVLQEPGNSREHEIFLEPFGEQSVFSLVYIFGVFVKNQEAVGK